MSDTLLPHNATAAELAFEAVMREAFLLPVPLREIWNPETCPAALLPWLAGAFSVDAWDPGWSEDAKRAVISDSVMVHRRKGTVGAMRQALEASGYGTAELVEGKESTLYNGAASYGGAEIYEPPDHWAEYRVYLDRPITADQAAQVREILASVAPARCHLKGLYFTRAANRYNAVIRYDGAFTHGVVQ